MHHLTQRVAWHDSRWEPRICGSPSENPFCVALDRIRAGRDDAGEDALAGVPWQELAPGQMPPCTFEAAGFMNEREWTRTFTHPYQSTKKTASTHGHLKPTRIKVPPYATFSVPFAWMLRTNQERIEEALPQPLPPDESAPFNTAWVFGRARQEALLNLVFDRLTPEHSLVFFYTKEGHPLGDSVPRLVVGVGRILSVGGLLGYESRSAETYPLWDRIIQHSITPAGTDGFLLPYHEYLKPTGEPDEDIRRRELLSEIAVQPDLAHIRQFSYVSELATPEVGLSTLVGCLEAVRRIRAHGIAEGPWEEREEWINGQIAASWKDRGAFPGLGSVLEALGLRLGTALSLEMAASGMVGAEEDPWPAADAMLRGELEPPQKAYRVHLEAARRTWARLPEERRRLLQLLSRFALTPTQARRWFDPYQRAQDTDFRGDDADILANPYRICEADLGTVEESPVSIGTVDRGLLPDNTVAARHPVPEPSAIASPDDPRRIRSGLVSVLRRGAERGDSLLSTSETIEGLDDLWVDKPFNVGFDWVDAHEDFLEGEVERLDLAASSQTGNVGALQLSGLKRREERLAKVLRARAGRELDSLGADWRSLITRAIGETGGTFDAGNAQHVAALEEQVEALERVTTRKLSALVGRAGTGKTSVLGALLECEPLARDGILLLAPTGKARVRLAKATKAQAMTVAQFLYRLGRYDAARQRPTFEGEQRRQEKTVIVDECSMLTMNDMFAILEALDLGHVQRLILVGDPNQLPPIGVGRPFADFTAFLEQAEESEKQDEAKLAGAMARLHHEVRSSAGAPSDTLKLAGWFTRERQSAAADLVFGDLDLGKEFNDLEICFWQTPDELRKRLMEQFERHLDLKGPDDVEGFNRALGFNEQKQIPFAEPDGVENFQVLSPVRMHPHGVHEINRWVQLRFRGDELRQGTQPWGKSLGDEDIVVRDKVIQVRNQSRGAYDHAKRQDEQLALANGEIGAMAYSKGKWLNAVFAGRPNLTVGYGSKDFPGGSGPLQLAYALTVHKAQGSDFRKVFVVLPKESRLISRELLYTALTRSQQRLVLLVEGTDASSLYGYTKPEESEVARRNTNLFQGIVRERSLEVPFAERLIHRSAKGHMVRSKSELVISNMLHSMDIAYEYERPFESASDGRIVWPDFTFVDASGELVLWEHLGMMDLTTYRDDWERKKRMYEREGFVEGENLLTTTEDERGGLDSEVVRQTAQRVGELL